VIVILNFKELNEEKQKVVQKVECIINNTKQNLELSHLDMLYLLTDLGEKDKEYLSKDLEDSLMVAIIKGKKKIFSNEQLTVLYKITSYFKMNDDYNAILFTLLQTSASIKDNINKAKDITININERGNLVSEAEALLKLNYSQLIEISKNINERGHIK
jgi:hypothetical protein